MRTALLVSLTVLAALALLAWMLGGQTATITSRLPLWHNADMAHAHSTSFDDLEDQAQAFSRDLLQRGECSDCVCRALAFAAMGLAYDTDNVASLRATLAALVRASEQDETLNISTVKAAH